MSSGKWRPFCLGLNVFKTVYWMINQCGTHTHLYYFRAVVKLFQLKFEFQIVSIISKHDRIVFDRRRSMYVVFIQFCRQTQRLEKK